MTPPMRMNKTSANTMEMGAINSGARAIKGILHE
eukprot:CAMPEP_0115412764 /NCGR_PEP_ID=MMETSP0271-20121206/21723_1 /TAXON_ID=71861 /ORGANISM="Scrippsiella trochoidea, Strain CCMP3099" /LENGTH=33 /DNA_ID= /DNA_START= /DNA_END= /DNA_ORIENTATION=